MSHNRLECIIGFLMFVTSTCKWMTPYRKGLNLTIYGWREGRDKYLHKFKSQPGVHMKVWGWENDSCLKER